MSPVLANLLSGGALVASAMVIVTLIRFRGSAGVTMPLSFLTLAGLLLSIRYERGPVFYWSLGGALVFLLAVDFVLRSRQETGESQ